METAAKLENTAANVVEGEFVPKTVNPVAALGVTEQSIREAGEKYKGIVISDHKSYEAAKAARTSMRTIRTGLEKGVKSITDEYRKQIEIIREKGGELVALARSYEDPLQETVKAYEAERDAEKKRKEAEEKARIDIIEGRINYFVTFPVASTSDEIMRQRTDMVERGFDAAMFDEFVDRASVAYDALLGRMNDALREATEREQAAAAQAAELEAARKAQEAAEAARVAAEAEIRRIREEAEARVKEEKKARELDNLRQSMIREIFRAGDLPSDVTSNGIKTRILGLTEPVAWVYEDRHHEAMAAYAQTLTILQRRLEEVKRLEEQAILAEAQRREEEQRREEAERLVVAEQEKAARAKVEAIRQKESAEYRADLPMLSAWVAELTEALDGCPIPAVTSSHAQGLAEKLQQDINKLLETFSVTALENHPLAQEQ